MSNENISTPSIQKLFKNQRYETEDLSLAERVYIEKTTPKPRTIRSDLVMGDVVVVLEGIFAAKKVIFIKQIPDHMALVSGVGSINGVGSFKIDERFLFKLNTKLSIDSVTINEDVYESRIDESEDVKMDTNNNQTLESALIKAIKKEKFMEAYLSEPFTIDQSSEFYSLEY